jgi:hypothetical protein
MAVEGAQHLVEQFLGRGWLVVALERAVEAEGGKHGGAS